MKQLSIRQTIEKYLGIALLGTLALVWWYSLAKAPSEENQGEVYRILYVHVPAAFTCFSLTAMLAFGGIAGYLKRHDDWLLRQRAAAELALVFTILTLATGSIWGRPTWGTWWTWDARLTTTFLLALLLAGWLLVYQSMPQNKNRLLVCSMLSLLIFIDVPIIYKSVTWWRSLHQPPSLLRAGGSSMAPEILRTLIMNILTMLPLGLWMGHYRANNLIMRDKIEKNALSAWES